MNTIDYIMTLQGRVNRYSNITCQDCAARAVRRGVTALSICDGAGSLKMCRNGAEFMSRVFANWAAENFHRLIRLREHAVIEEGVELIEQVLSVLERKFDAPRKSFGSTLLVGACDERGRCLVLHLGDGLIAGIDAAGHTLTVSAPEGIANATYLTCCDERMLHQHLRVHKPKNLKSLFLTSDGSKDILYIVEGEEVQVSSEIASLMSQLQDDRDDFSRCFPSFVDSSIKPLDDFSVAMLIPAVRRQSIRHGLRSRLKAAAARMSRSSCEKRR